MEWGIIPLMVSVKYAEWLIKVGGGTDGGAQTRAAKVTGVCQGQISKIFKKRRGDVRIDTLERIANKMDCEIWQLLFAIDTGSLLPPKAPSGSTKKQKDY